jgi:Ca2+-binding RTX toxin-like protein
MRGITMRHHRARRDWPVLRRLALVGVLAVPAALPAIASADVTRCNGLEVTKRGTDGPDSIVGTSGRDVIAVVEAGIDGADSFFGGAGRDIMSYAARTTGIRVSLYGFPNDGALPFGEGDNIGAGNDVENVIGGSGNDSFNARAFFGGVLFEGRSGDDRFDTRNGVVDTNDGGIGNDTCLGDPIDVRISCER